MSDTFAPLAWSGSQGFRPDARFAPQSGPAPAPAPEAAFEPDDPIEIAWAEGYIAGRDEAQAAALEQARADAAARTALDLSFRRLDAEMTEALRQRLITLAKALCEGILAPLALDEEALLRRIERALGMLARAGDERVLRLNPHDMALVSLRLAGDLHIEPDPSLPRGALRVETGDGGVEDGPGTWAEAVAEALKAC